MTKDTKNVIVIGQGKDWRRLQRNVISMAGIGLVIVPLGFAAIAGIVTHADKIDKFFQKILSSVW